MVLPPSLLRVVIIRPGVSLSTFDGLIETFFSHKSQSFSKCQDVKRFREKTSCVSFEPMQMARVTSWLLAFARCTKEGFIFSPQRKTIQKSSPSDLDEVLTTRKRMKKWRQGYPKSLPATLKSLWRNYVISTASYKTHDNWPLPGENLQWDVLHQGLPTFFDYCPFYWHLRLHRPIPHLKCFDTLP